MTVTRLDLALLHKLLQVPEHEGAYRLVRRAQQTSGTLSQLVVSLAVAEGVEAGSGSRDLLARAASRAARYAELRTALDGCTGVRTVKGPSLAAHYPPGVRRPVGDLDLVASDEEQLWRAAAVLCSLGGEPAELSLFTADGRLHVMLAVLWPSPDALLEEEIRVELCTAAFSGDFATVPVRPDLPAEQSLADLLSVAEERFQREFHAKDAVDLLMLLDSGAPAATAAAAAGHRLAPELLELVDLLSDAVVHPAAGELRQALAAGAAEESARRAAAARPVQQQQRTVAARLEAGQPVWGMPLTRTAHPGQRCLLEHRSALSLARTPVGDFLLVADEVVDPDVHAAALAAATGEEAGA
ncbi:MULTISPECIES: nucleotidyltransferase family protein [unclassified Streptomyces]|uniref:nucleotidyltransferase family protein n=1 Tax=unclassified Streptomyces TaxID=2593676 RepID=UPI0011A0F723|nr:nucleotidyltransferase family protein [Streptomyces sp. BK340]TVZ96334.1 hypothetical protein FB157_103242 [Streptomyces sp. BK340]